MKTFEQYLRERGYRPKTITTYRKEATGFLTWLQEQGLALEELQYQDLLQMIREAKHRGHSVGQLNLRLRSIRLYYLYLMGHGQALENPAQGLSVKGQRRRLPHDLWEKEDLEALYREYPAKDPVSQRNQVILGLMVYQALTIADLESLKTHDVQLAAGKLQLPGAGGSHPRTLPLASVQVLALRQYLTLTRNQLQQQLPENLKPKDQMFFNAAGNKALRGILARLIQQLKITHPESGTKLTMTKIRESVIAHWLKSKDIRIVQYLAGHKYASSTERYRATRLEDLQQALKQYHPLVNEALRRS